MRNTLYRWTGLLLAVTLIAAIAGCSDSPTPFEPAPPSQPTILQRTSSTPGLAKRSRKDRRDKKDRRDRRDQVSDDDATVADDGYDASVVSDDDGDVLEASAEVYESEGGVIIISEVEIGAASLSIPAGALPNDRVSRLIRLVIETEGDLGVVLHPHAIQFDQSVTLTISYDGADLGGIDETTLAIYYFNEDTGLWELVPGSVVDTFHNRVTAELWHFSKYAIGGNG